MLRCVLIESEINFEFELVPRLNEPEKEVPPKSNDSSHEKTVCVVKLNPARNNCLSFPIPTPSALCKKRFRTLVSTPIEIGISTSIKSYISFN